MKIDTDSDDSKPFLQMIIQLILQPKETWADLAKPYVGPRQELTRYYVPALILSLSGGLFGQTVFGIYVRDQFIKPEFGPLLIQTACYGVAQLILPFLLAKPLRSLSKRLGGSSELEANRRLLMMSYLPSLALSAFQFVPVFNLIAIIISIYGLYIFYTGIGPILQIPEERQLIFCVLSMILILFYLFMVSLLVLISFPQPYPELIEMIQNS